MVFIELFNFSFFCIPGRGIDLDYCDIEWFALETNRNYSVVFEIASKYCISDSFVDHGGCDGCPIAQTAAMGAPSRGREEPPHV